MLVREMLSQTKELGFASIYLIKPNLVCIQCIKEEVISVEMGIKILESIKELVGENKHASLINLSNLYAPSKEFFKFIVSQRNPEKDHIVARAVVTTNAASRIDGQNFINYFKPLTPTKLFSTVDEAISWLETHLNHAD